MRKNRCLRTALACVALGVALLAAPVQRVWSTQPDAQASTQPDALPTNYPALSLLVCDNANEAARIAEVLRACGLPAVSMPRADYTQELLKDYARVITTERVVYLDAVAAKLPVFCVGARCGKVGSFATQGAKSASIELAVAQHTQSLFARETALLLTDVPAAQAVGTLTRANGHSHAFAAIEGSVGYAPWYEPNSLCDIALAAAVQQWAGLAVQSAQMYVMVDEINPFDDLQMLCRTAEVLHDNGIPFVFRIMPFYDNLDYPAFSRFAQVLRYAQSLGGAVVLHEPVKLYSTGSASPAARRQQLLASLQGEFMADITPAQQAGGDSLATKLQATKQALTAQGVVCQEMRLPPIGFSLEQLSKVAASTQNFGTYCAPSMLRFVPFSDENALQAAVQTMGQQWLSLSRYGDGTVLRYDETAFDEAVDDFDYRAQTQVSLGGFFSGASTALVVVVGVSVALFLALLWTGRRLYLRKFYKK